MKISNDSLDLWERLLIAERYDLLVLQVKAFIGIFNWRNPK